MGLTGETSRAAVLEGWPLPGGRGPRPGSPHPHQYFPVLVHGQALPLDELSLQVLQGVILELELPFERAIGHAASPSEQGNRLIQNLLEGHRRPSTALGLGPRKGKVRHASVYQERAPRVYQQDESVAGEIAPRCRCHDFGA
jgi:hypothetical protein